MINFKILMMLFVGTVLMGCSDFLDEKSDKKLAVPTTLQDLEALLGYTDHMNFPYGANLGEIASDNLFIPDDAWGTITQEGDRALYIWQFIPIRGSYWAVSYQRILNANVVLENINNIKDQSESRLNQVKGMALFYRAASFFDLLQIFSTSFEREYADNNPGIVLRLSGDVDENLSRNSLLECMIQIETDLLNAEKLLDGWMSHYPTQPSITSVYALLSKYYLMTKDYEKSLNYASRCLDIQSELLDYNLISEGKYPFERYNKEVLFFSLSTGATIMNETRARISPVLYDLYTEEDMRKKLFFTKNADGYYTFTGDYSRNTSDVKFCGLTTAEIWLTKAECNIRLDKKEDAIQDMQYFLPHRYSNISHQLEQMDNAELLRFILEERRKELVFRGTRWFDLKRLINSESGLQNITRTVNGKEHSITLTDIKAFRFAIPQSVIDATNIEP